MTKDESILRVLDRLDLHAHGWTTLDNWDADLFAIGIGRANDPTRYVYVSTWDMPAGRYHFDAETRSESGPTTVAHGDDVDFEALVAALKAHLT